MKPLQVLVALHNKDNDYQLEQSASATEAASRLGVKINFTYAGNDAVTQTQQLLEIIQDKYQHPDAILVEPVGTAMPQVAKAATTAGIAWGVMNREADYISELRRSSHVPVFVVGADQAQVGSIQGQQLAALVTEGNILYIEGPSNSSITSLRSRGFLSSKPVGVAIKMVKGDWSERSAYNAVKSWLSLSTSKDLRIRAVVGQNDAMAMGARKAFLDLPHLERIPWMDLPFLGIDGVSRTGQEWVRHGHLRATVVIPPTPGVALEVLAKALRNGSQPAEYTLVPSRSFPQITEIGVRVARA